MPISVGIPEPTAASSSAIYDPQNSFPAPQFYYSLSVIFYISFKRPELQRVVEGMISSTMMDTREVLTEKEIKNAATKDGGWGEYKLYRKQTNKKPPLEEPQVKKLSEIVRVWYI